ncbi:MAG TPA: winged helix-turn-helix domain-containing protein [Pyrinomonadaceae bacterium]|nr:winged helix-turn-helix domain-containing protein [Pyrinomonadaceae bacterium]
MSAQETKSEEPVDLPRDSFEFGRFRFHIDENGATLTSGGRLISLSTAEATILRALLERNGEFVTTEDLLKLVSPSPMASENLVHGAVRGLRRTLNDADLIRNERSRGYAFTGNIAGRLHERSGDTTSPATPRLAFGSQVETHPPPGRDPFIVVALMVTAPVVLLPFGLLLFGGNWESLPRQLGFIQALMILVAIGYDFYFADVRDLSGIDGETRRAHLALQQLRRFWRLLLASWCCLYLTLPFSQWFAPLAGQTPSWQWQAIQVTATFLNNASALMLVLCYLVLNRPTVIRVADREVENVSLRPGLFVILALGILEAILVALSDRIGSPNASADVLFAFDLLSGVAGGIAMALCISRFDSRLLGTKGLLPIIPIVLYFYVVIQPFYPLINRTFPNRFGLSQHFDLWIIQLAFLLKAVMYIYVTDLFRSERFFFYMIHARRVYENVETDWSNFKSGRKA